MTMTAQTGGVGLNVTEANQVIFLDRWYNVKPGGRWYNVQPNVTK